VPLPPGFSGSPQAVNAGMFQRAGAAELLLDRDLSAARLEALLLPLLADPERRARMAAAARTFAQPEAAATLAGLVAALATPRVGG
jgi:UDP-N-acetylglucosamine--N-acetylmuramyl-(pentapeptide) pyrophosphoryl-undecaprenol N-acetylglucosamine transferase